MYKYKSCAKLNSFLNVTSVLDSGYHELKTHFQLIDLFDEIEFQETDKFLIDSNVKLNPDDNSILAAINWFNKKFDLDQNFKVLLNKTIPIGGGLGGGSSNCATTLKFLCDFHSIETGLLDYEDICFELGADVPIFLHGKSSFAEGCGQKFTKNFSYKSNYVLIVPDIFISTEKIFKSNKLYVSPEINVDKNCFFDVVLHENEEFSNFLSSFKRNYPLELAQKLKLSGTGSTMFIENPTNDEIKLIMHKNEKNFRVFQVKALEYYH